MSDTQEVSALDANLLWEWMDYYPHPKQRPIHESTARNRLASCGRRFGKSKLGGVECAQDALASYTIAETLRSNGEQIREWVVGPNYDDDEREFRVFYDAMKRLEVPMDRPGTYYDPRGGNMQMSLWDGRFILECRSAAHPESLDGEGLNKVLLVEAAKLKFSVWTKYIRPALADKRGEALLTSTPEGKNWFYDFYRRGQDPKNRAWQSWRMPSWFNTEIFPGGKKDPEILAMKEDMSDEFFAQEVAADFSDFVGRVFKRWDEETHVRSLSYDPRLPVYAAADYGWSNPTVWLIIQVDVFGNVYVLDEKRWTQTTTEDIAKDLMDWNGGISRKVKTFYPDPAEPDRTATIAEKLRIKPNASTGGPLRDRLDMIRTALKPGPEHAPFDQQLPHLFIDGKCVELIREMGEYRYPEKKNEEAQESEEPMKKDDHGPEALGRFFKGHRMSGKLRARQSKANIKAA